MNSNITFTKNNIKSPHIIILWTIFATLCVGLLIVSILRNNSELLSVSLLVLLFLIILFAIGFLTKVTISNEGITHSSIIKNYTINWSEIQTVGVYRINRYSLTLVKPEDFNKFSFFGQKFIFISKQENYLPTKMQKWTSDFIDLHWRQEAWDEINSRLYQKKAASS